MIESQEASAPNRGPGLGGWTRAILRGVGQVMFQGHALTGILFLVGIAFASPLMGAGALAGSAIGTLTARLLKFDPGEIRDGLYGFNGTLVGIAAFFFLKPVVGAVLLMVAGSAASSVVTWLMRRFVPFPTYTAPFIVVTWAMVAVADAMPLARVELPLPPNALDISSALFDGLSEVFLQANRVTGLFFLAGLAVSNWRHASLALAGSVLGTLVGIYHSDPAGSVSIGIYGYNASLAAIALYLWRKSLLAPLCGVLISTPITEYFSMTGLPTLTAPFVLACWIVIVVGAAERGFVESTG